MSSEPVDSPHKGSASHRKQELRGAMSVAIIMMCRMLGLFMILPVFALAAEHTSGATPFLIGVALGVYGFTQALLQIPFGKCSDHFGRRPVIAAGLVLFACGSVVAAMSHGIYGLILGRALQGAGAIGSTCLALLADLTRDEFRTRAMAIVGMSIGFSFSLALVLGPVIYASWHLSGIFWLTAAFAGLGLMCLFAFMPSPPRVVASPMNGVKAGQWQALLGNRELLRLDWAIFAQHAILTGFFLLVPHILAKQLLLTSAQQVGLYLVVVVLAFMSIIPGVIFAEKKRQLRLVMRLSIALLGVSLAVCWWGQHQLWCVVIALWLFFTAFSLLESILPSLVSKLAPLAQRGTAMGIYSTSQFLGIFVGGVAGGYIIQHFGASAGFALVLVLALLWLGVAAFMREPGYYSTVILELSHIGLPLAELTAKLKGTVGVGDIAVSEAEQLVYIKVDKHKVEITQLRHSIEAGTL